MASVPIVSVIEQLSAICREHFRREKIIVVPSLAIGHQIADVVAQRGTDWVNLRAETMRTLADAVAGFELARQGLTVLSRAQALAIIETACDRGLDDSSYFAELSDRPGLHRAIQKSIDDLRLAGVRPAAISAASFEDARKAADLQKILDAYEAELARGKFIDRCGVLAHAIGMLEEGAPRPWNREALWFVVDDLELSAQEERFLRLCAGMQPEPWKDRNTREEGSAGLPSRHCEEAQPTKQSPLGLLALQSQSEISAAGIGFQRAAGDENELRAAFRSILGDGGRFDAAEIVYTLRDAYLPLAYELASEYAIPTTFAEGIAASFSRPGQACLGFLRWIGGGWEAAALQEMARAGALDLGAFTTGDPLSRDPISDEPLSGSALSRILRAAAIGWGRERYTPRLEAWIAAREPALAGSAGEDDRDDTGPRERARKEAGRGRAALSFIEALLAMTAPIAAGDEIEVVAVARAASQFVRELARVRSEIDGMARAALIRMLDELATLPAASARRQDAGARLSEAVRSLHVGASNPRPGHLHVSPMRAGGWSGRARLFVVGLDDAKHPGSGLQDPVLLDAERKSINLEIDPRRLPIVGEAPGRSTGQFKRLLGRGAPGAKVTLLYSALDLGDRRERYPSSDLLEIYRIVRGRPKAAFGDLIAELQDDTAGFAGPLSSAAAPLSETEWWLARRFVHQDTGLAQEVPASYPWLAAGAEAGAARDSEAITKWDGRIRVDAREIDPRRSGRVYSASQLENMAKCPYRWFLEKMLRIEPLEEVPVDPDQWLSAAQFGVLFHDVLQKGMELVCAEGKKPTLAAESKRFTEVAEQALAQWRERVPIAGESAFERRRGELLRNCEVFLRTEERDGAAVTPRYFELSFGRGEASREASRDLGGMAMPEPLAVPLGDSAILLLRGQIDRVDYGEATDTWEVWDYKSGSLYEYHDAWQLARGTKLQHAIYKRALEAMLARRFMSGRVARSGYYFPTEKGNGARIEGVSDPGQFERALNLLFDVVGSGFFPHSDAEACKYCEFKRVCGDPKTAAERSARKAAANPGDPAVQAWLQLQEVP